MDRLTKEEIQRLVELSKKATQGKWAIDARYSNHAEIRSHRLYAGAYERLVADTFSQSLYAQDAEFIAALVNWFRANHQSLSLESVREEALEEACKGWMAWYPNCAQLLDGWHADTAWTEWDSTVREGLKTLGDQTLRALAISGVCPKCHASGNTPCAYPEDCGRALQSPARVAEGGQVREALSNLVSLLLQTMEPIGPMRDRKDYPPELQTAINVLRASPESPAKEQLWEQFAAPQDSEAGANRPGNSLSGLPAVAAPDAAEMVKRLRYIADTDDARFGEIASTLNDAAALIEKLGQGWIPPRDWILVERSALQVAITMLEYAEDDPDDHAQASTLSTYFDQLLRGVIVPPPPERP